MLRAEINTDAAGLDHWTQRLNLANEIKTETFWICGFSRAPRLTRWSWSNYEEPFDRKEVHSSSQTVGVAA
jgi:hypothetical protein